MGAKLFLRSRGRKNIITPSGEALYRFACEMLTKSNELQNVVRGYQGEPAQAFSIVVQRTLANYRLPAVMGPFLRAHPSLSMSLYGETQERVLQLLQAGSVDAAIAFETPAIALRDGHRIGAEQLVIVAAPAHPLASAKRVALAELAAFGFVGGLKESEFFDLICNALRSSGLERYHVVVHMQDSVGIKNAVMRGLGLACTLSCAVEQEIAEGKLVAVAVDPGLPSLSIRFMTASDSRSPSLVEEFRHELHANWFGVRGPSPQIA